MLNTFEKGKKRNTAGHTAQPVSKSQHINVTTTIAVAVDVDNDYVRYIFADGRYNIMWLPVLFVTLGIGWFILTEVKDVFKDK